MNIGQVIRALRTEKKLTQEVLALAAGTNAGYISKIENGKRKPSMVQLEEIAVALGTTVPALYAAASGGEVEPPPELADQAPADMSQIAIQLRQGFRQLTPENQYLALRFVKMLGQVQREAGEPSSPDR